MEETGRMGHCVGQDGFIPDADKGFATFLRGMAKSSIFAPFPAPHLYITYNTFYASVGGNCTNSGDLAPGIRVARWIRRLAITC